MGNSSFVFPCSFLLPLSFTSYKWMIFRQSGNIIHLYEVKAGVLPVYYWQPYGCRREPQTQRGEPRLSVERCPLFLQPNAFKLVGAMSTCSTFETFKMKRRLPWLLTLFGTVCHRVEAKQAECE